MQSLKSQLPVISDAEKLICLQKDMTYLRQKVTSLSARYLKDTNEKIDVCKNNQELKKRIEDLETLISTKANIQSFINANDILNSLNNTFKVHSADNKNEIYSIIDKIDKISASNDIINYTQSECKNDILNILHSIKAIRQEILNQVNFSLSELRKMIENKIASIRDPKEPIEESQIKSWIMDLIVPLMKDVKDTVDRSREVKVKLLLLEKKIENR